MKRRFNDNTLEAAAVIFGIKHKPETFKPIPKETIDKRMLYIIAKVKQNEKNKIHDLQRNS